MKYCILLTLVATLLACAQDEPAPKTEQSGLALTVDILSDTDVAGIEYLVTAVDCDTGQPLLDPEPVLVIEELANMFIPGGNPDLDKPYDAGSAHLFADHFFWLEAGCYDVLTTPVQNDGSPSEDCARASAQAVEVVDGETIEIHLINQCRAVGPGAGGLDVISSLNHPPEVVGVWFEDSKFICADDFEICFEIRDPDGDPIRGVVEIETPEGLLVPLAEETTLDNGTTILCYQFPAPATPGDYEISAVFYDLGYDANGDPVTIEALLAAQGEDGLSRASVRAPIHVTDPDHCFCACPDGYTLNADETACERTLISEPAATGQEVVVCQGDQNENYSVWGGRYPDGLVNVDPFFMGRLNRRGVWGCQDTPNMEWNGFSTCIDLPAAGDYLVGIAGDNRVRLHVDGALTFSTPGLLLEEFRYWNMIPLSLTAGPHSIALAGLNFGGPAAFGAEIYGPFPAGSLSDDAAMMAADVENNIVWSTFDQLRGTFQTGESIGWSCPDGSVYDLCSERPVCIETVVEACL